MRGNLKTLFSSFRLGKVKGTSRAFVEHERAMFGLGNNIDVWNGFSYASFATEDVVDDVVDGVNTNSTTATDDTTTTTTNNNNNNSTNKFDLIVKRARENRTKLNHRLNQHDGNSESSNSNETAKAKASDFGDDWKRKTARKGTRERKKERREQRSRGGGGGRKSEENSVMIEDRARNGSDGTSRAKTTYEEQRRERQYEQERLRIEQEHQEYYDPLTKEMKNLIPANVLWVSRELSREGYKCYLVGGAVRDLLKCERPRDFDVMTNASYQKLREIFGYRRTRIVGKSFKVCHVSVNQRGDKFLEVSSCAEEEEEDDDVDDDGVDDDDVDDDDIDDAELRGNNHNHNNNNHNRREYRTKTKREYLRADAMKRDFTINGMAYEPKRSILYDFVDGYEDLKDNIVRSIVDPHIAFKDDPARILRAIRVSAKRNMEPTKEVRATMRAYAPLLLELQHSRKLQELRACLARGYASTGVKLLWMSCTLDALVPTLAKFIKDRGGKKRTMLEFTKTGFEQILDAKTCFNDESSNSYNDNDRINGDNFKIFFKNDSDSIFRATEDDDAEEEEEADDSTATKIIANSSLVNNNKNNKSNAIPNGITAGGLFKLLATFDAYARKDVRLTEEGVSAEFLLAILATPIALYYAGLKTIPQYTQREEMRVVGKTKNKVKERRKPKMGLVSVVNPAFLRWESACQRVLDEFKTEDKLFNSNERKGQNLKIYTMMTIGGKRNIRRRGGSAAQVEALYEEELAEKEIEEEEIKYPAHKRSSELKEEEDYVRIVRDTFSEEYTEDELWSM